MFNEERKFAFIHYYTEKESIRERTFTIFNASESYEKNLNKDLSEFTNEEMSTFFSEKSGIKTSSRIMVASTINAYLKWCSGNGFIVVCSEIKQNDITLASIYRDEMVFSIEHLCRYMDAVFGDIESGTSGLMCRCYFWLAFCGLSSDEAERIEDNDIHIDSMSVTVGGREVPLYAESKDAFLKLRSLKEIRVFNPLAPDKVIMMKREDGSRFLRGAKRSGVSKTKIGDGERGNMSGEVGRRTRKAYSSGKVIARLNFKNVRASGLFCRMLERETRGIPADFSVIAAEEVANKSFANKKSYTASFCRIKNNYATDYEIWKMAYEIYKEDSHL